MCRPRMALTRLLIGAYTMRVAYYTTEGTVRTYLALYTLGTTV